MTESQAQALAQSLASALHQLTVVESRRAVEEYRARHEPDATVDTEVLKLESVQARRDLESVLKVALLEIRLDERKRPEPTLTELVDGDGVSSSYPWQKGKG